MERSAGLSAAEIECAVVGQLGGMLRSPEIVVGAWRAAREQIDGFTDAEVRDAFEQFDHIWDELFPAD